MYFSAFILLEVEEVEKFGVACFFVCSAFAALGHHPIIVAIYIEFSEVLAPGKPPYKKQCLTFKYKYSAFLLQTKVLPQGSIPGRVVFTTYNYSTSHYDPG